MTSMSNAFILGVGLYLALRKVFYLIMLHFKECESLGPFDEMYFFDTEKHMANYVGTTFFDPFEFESMRDYLFAKTENIHKSRSKVVKKFGQYWFKKMSKKEWDAKKSKVIQRVDHVHNKDQLVEFMKQQMSIRIPLDTVQWGFFLIPNYIEGQSVIIVKGHHSFADGVGLG